MSDGRLATLVEEDGDVGRARKNRRRSRGRRMADDPQEGSHRSNAPPRKMPGSPTRRRNRRGAAGVQGAARRSGEALEEGRERAGGRVAGSLASPATRARYAPRGEAPVRRTWTRTRSSTTVSATRASSMSGTPFLTARARQSSCLPATRSCTAPCTKTPTNTTSRCASWQEVSPPWRGKRGRPASRAQGPAGALEQPPRSHRPARRTAPDAVSVLRAGAPGRRRPARGRWSLTWLATLPCPNVARQSQGTRLRAQVVDASSPLPGQESGC